jgi:hypothetical protein
MEGGAKILNVSQKVMKRKAQIKMAENVENHLRGLKMKRWRQMAKRR